MAGIYCILCLCNQRAYIGSSKTLQERLLHHKRSLRRRKHFNKHLQSAWDMYGSDNFTFFILEECSLEDLTKREQHYIDQIFYSDRAYNSRKIAESNIGYKITEDTRKRMSLAQKVKIMPKDSIEVLRIKLKGNNNGAGNKGRILENTSRIKASRSSGFIPRYLIHEDGMLVYVETIRGFCKEYELTRTNVSKVISGERKQHKGWYLYDQFI